MTGTPRSWRELREWQVDLLLRATGVDEWNARVRDTGPAAEPHLRAWLAERGVIGYAPQYADRPALRAVLDAVVAAAAQAGELTVQARRTFVSLVTPLDWLAPAYAANI